MMKISIIDSRTQRRLVLDGKLIAPWDAELLATWKAANVDLQGRRLIIDLKNVTSISREGANVLLELIRAKAKLSCDGVFIKYVVQQLTRQGRAAAGKFLHPLQSGYGGQKGQK